MSRRDELISIVPEDSLELVTSVIDDVVFLEERLTELKKLPFIQLRRTPNGKKKNFYST